MGRANRPINASTEITALGSANFMNSFVRAGSANYFDSAGTLQTAGANVLRTTYTDTSSTNLLRNPRAEGGVAGQPGSQPTNFGFSNIAGAPRTLTFGVDSAGREYSQAQWTGSVTGGTFSMAFEATNFIPAAQGQTFTFSVYVSINATFDGGIPSANVPKIVIIEYDSTGTFTGTQGSSGQSLLNQTTMGRVSFTYTTQAANCAFVRPTLQFTPVANAAFDMTMRAAYPQFEYGSTVGGLALPPNGTLAPSSLRTVVRALIEGSKTNGIRNPRAEGSTVGVIGSGGVAPTNWTISGGAGVAMSVVGTGTESGIPYIDVRCNGTASGAIFPAVFFEANNSIAAVNTDRRTISAFLRLVSGSWTNVSGIGLGGWEYSAVPAFLASNTGTNTFPTFAPLSSQRQSYLPTMGQATTAFWQPLVTVSLANGAVVDFTLRIGAPQDEAGSGATSVILPAVGTPLATTRAFDVWTGAGAGLSWLKQTATTNLVQNSADFSAATWAKGTSLTVTVDSTAAPDGSVTADTIIPDVTSQPHQALSNTISFVAGNYYTVSVFAKPSGYTFLHMRFPSAAFGIANGRSAWFNTSTGAFASDAGTNAAMTLTSNGFYRCSITMLCIASTSGTPVIGVNNSASSGIQTFPGDGVSGLFVWGAQVEAAQVPTSYVPTVAASASRTSPAAFTFIMRATYYDAAINNPASNFSSPLHLDDGTAGNQIDLTVTNGVPKFSTQVGGVNQIFLSGGNTIPINVTTLIGICADNNGGAMCWGGGTVFTDISNVQMPNVNILRIGRNNTANWPFYGEVRRLTYFPYRMTSAQLQAATT
jgi:hypothetical protein